jgi:uncharacterized protein YkwD
MPPMRCRALLLCAWLCLAAPALGQQVQIRLRPASPPDAAGQPPVADTGQVAALLVDMTNALRRREGVRPLATNRALAKAAVDFAQFMSADDKYGHTADGRKPADRIEAAGYDYCLVDENIAWLVQTGGFTTERLAQQLFDDWQHSAEHRRNLLNPHLGETGVAVARSSKTGRYYGVQEFGRPKSEQIAFEIRNASDAELTYRIDGERFRLESRYGRRHKRAIPPALEIAGYADSAGREVTLHPATGEQYVARRDADDRVAVEIIKAAGTPENAAAGTAKLAD